MTGIETWADASIGRRELQEDWHAVVPLEGGRVLLVVADGMGGHAAGEVASRIAGEKFVASLLSEPAQPGDNFIESVSAANVAIAEAVDADSALEGMGTTLLGALVSRDGLRWVSVGDSVLLLIREGAAMRLNADHSLGAQLDAQVARGEISAAEAAGLGARNALLSAVAGDEIEMAELVTAPVPLLPGDIVLAASDGLLTLEPGRIETLAGASWETLGDFGRGLLDAIATINAPHQDNATVVLARI